LFIVLLLHGSSKVVIQCDMPRESRLDIPGLLQHVIVRGIERRKIFFSDIDRMMFLNRFSSLLEETGTDCYAWALIPNHFHLLLRPNNLPLSNFMRRLLTGYAVNFNLRHRRVGHVFQNRYKSIVCEEDAYLLELIRYIHLNPLRAKIVTTLDDLNTYPWSGHAIVMGNRKLVGHNVKEVLLFFGQRINAARNNYLQFVEEGIVAGSRPELVGGGLRRSKATAEASLDDESYDARILGSGKFVDELRKEPILKERIMATPITLVALLDKVARLFDLTEEDLKWRSKKTNKSEARAVFCYAAVRLLKANGSETGKVINIGRSAVSQAVLRGAKYLQKNHTVLEQLK